MSATTRETGRTGVRQAGRITTASFGLVIMLIIQYALGIAYNLYGTAPTAAKKVGAFSSPLLAIHVIMGILLIVASIYLVVQAVRSRIQLAVVTAVIGMLSLLGAGVTGSEFTETGGNGFSLAMGMTTAVALLCYVVNLRVLRENRHE